MIKETEETCGPEKTETRKFRAKKKSNSITFDVKLDLNKKSDKRTTLK